jgi:gas vesicle protein
MKDMMRAQQKLMMNSMYGGLAKELNLTTEQNEKLTELLLDQQMKALDGFTKEGATNAGAPANSFSETQKQSDESIKALLGEEKFAQYQEYKKTVGERMQLNMFTQQMEGAQTPLQEEQTKQLMGLIREEHEKNPPALSEELKTDSANFAKLFSGDLMEKQMQWQEEMNRRVLDRAAQILTPDQLKAYADFQNQQLNMQRLGMKMAGGMFGNKDEPADSKPAPLPEK